MSKRILANVKSYFEAHLKVKSYDLLTSSSSSCSDVVFPDINDEPIDLYIMIQPENDAQVSYFAAASTCSVIDIDQRPVKGIYYLNFAEMEMTQLKEYFYFSTFAHELTHILGFSGSLFQFYKKDDKITARPESEIKNSK